MNAQKITEMVNRFLGWKLPNDFAPDAGISFQPGHVTPSSPFWPAGTNLLTADQARSMFEHVTADESAGELPPHQQRVVTEKAELDKKAHALSQFIGHSQIFDTLDPAEQERMKEQNDVMWQYSEILGKRIAAFTAAA